MSDSEAEKESKPSSPCSESKNESMLSTSLDSGSENESKPSTSVGSFIFCSVLPCPKGVDAKVEPPNRSYFAVGEPSAKRHMTVEEVRSMWNLVKISCQLGTREQAIAFLEKRGIIQASKMCGIHKKPMHLNFTTNKVVGTFACYRGQCRYKSKMSRARGTWFENIKIPLPQVLYLMYAYASKWSYDTTLKEDFSEGAHCLSRATIADWFNFFREAIVMYVIEKQKFVGKIGGPGKVVQIDDRKFGKRKHIKDQHIEGQWVIGMIEDGSEDLRLEVSTENIRSPEVLVPLIKKHVEEGTIIYTDSWSAYKCLSEHGYVHRTVDNSDPKHRFVAQDGTNTQRIESQWAVVKRYFLKDNISNREYFTDLLYEYLWRREMAKHHKDPFEEVLKIVNHVYKK